MAFFSFLSLEFIFLLQKDAYNDWVLVRAPSFFQLFLILFRGSRMNGSKGDLLDRASNLSCSMALTHEWSHLSHRNIYWITSSPERTFVLPLKLPSATMLFRTCLMFIDHFKNAYVKQKVNEQGTKNFLGVQWEKLELNETNWSWMKQIEVERSKEFARGEAS